MQINGFDLLASSIIVNTFAKLFEAAPMASTLREIIRNGEGSQVEFKKTLPQLEKIAKTLVAFANTKGGSLLVGIQDDKYVVGISDSEEERFVLLQAIKHFTDPLVPVHIREEELYGKLVLVVEVEESKNKPHKALSLQNEWVIYIRSGDQCMIATPLVTKAFNLEKEGRDEVKSRTLTNNEQALFGFLDRQKRITLKDYAKLINVSKRRAYKILIALTLNGKLFMHDLERTIFFTKV